MDDRKRNELRDVAARTLADLLEIAGAEMDASIKWFQPREDLAASVPFRVDDAGATVAINRILVAQWFDDLPTQTAELRFAGLVLRAAVALIHSATAHGWQDAADLHIRTEQDRGLDESYALAFAAAHRILESHRLDHCALELVPEAGGRLAELVRFDLDAHPDFDVYPRAAIAMGRPNLPDELTNPAVDALIDGFGVDEAEELTGILSQYVALPSDAVSQMVDLTAMLVFQAFPDAMGLTVTDPSEVWAFRGRIRSDDEVGWRELKEFLRSALAGFAGSAGLDLGDALLVGLGDDPVTGRRVGAWAHDDELVLDYTHAELKRPAVRKLIERGWIQYENAPNSFHKTFVSVDFRSAASDMVWILRRLEALPGPGGLTLLGRGAPEAPAADRGWDVDDVVLSQPPEPIVGYPVDHEHLADLVLATLRRSRPVAPDEYGPGRFRIDDAGLDISVLATEETYPVIRFHHAVIDPDDSDRDDIIDFANALLGRTSTMGSHWWLGNNTLWQVCEFFADKFDQDIFQAQLDRFIEVAHARTPEIRARFRSRS